MAFSTQKDFFHVPFMNESYDFGCQDACVQLKSYPSTVDDRSWAANEDKKSRFVADLVACNTPIGCRSYGPSGGDASEPTDGQHKSPGAHDDGRYLTGNNVKREIRGSDPEDMFGWAGNLVVGDSLINAADKTIGRMEELLVMNKLLEKKPEDSSFQWSSPKPENAEIKRIMNQRYNPYKGKSLRIKIKELADANKIDPNDEQELNKIQKAIEDMNKAYEILQGENSDLRRLIDKLSGRIKMENIALDPEKNSDVPYLQNKINELGREVILLRQTEDELMKGKKTSKFSPEYDVNNIKYIIEERDSLRKKVQVLKLLENQLNDLQQKAQEADFLSSDLSANLNNQSQYINDIENEMQDMQHYYEKEVQQSKFNEEMLKCRCDELKQEFMTIQCAAQHSESLQMEIDVLRNDLRKRVVALNAYDSQYQQLMIFILNTLP